MFTVAVEFCNTFTSFTCAQVSQKMFEIWKVQAVFGFPLCPPISVPLSLKRPESNPWTAPVVLRHYTTWQQREAAWLPLPACCVAVETWFVCLYRGSGNVLTDRLIKQHKSQTLKRSKLCQQNIRNFIVSWLYFKYMPRSALFRIIYSSVNVKLFCESGSSKDRAFGPCLNLLTLIELLLIQLVRWKASLAWLCSNPVFFKCSFNIHVCSTICVTG